MSMEEFTSNFTELSGLGFSALWELRSLIVHPVLCPHVTMTAFLVHLQCSFTRPSLYRKYLIDNLCKIFFFFAHWRKLSFPCIPIRRMWDKLTFFFFFLSYSSSLWKKVGYLTKIFPLHLIYHLNIGNTW